MTVFREAEPGDFDQIMGLCRQLQPSDPVLGRHRRCRVQADPELARPAPVVLEDNGTVIATAYLNVIPNLTRSAAPYAVIENVVVDKALRGTGRGKQLMAATLQAAWDAGCYKAMLMTGSRNPATHAFYRACGFSADAKTGYVARPS